jgi:SAM-dependent methyltransferase
MESTNAYRRPSHIPETMGGDGEGLDSRLAGVFALMQKAPLQAGQKILDIGMGSGQLATWLAGRGLQVTGTGLELESYCDVGALRSQGIAVVPCGADRMPLETGTFDAVVISHVLEHCPNVRSTLDEARRVLKDDGWLLIFVPSQALDVSAGHVSMGWSVGQLMYVLLTAGYRVKDGQFVTHAGSVCAFVRKEANPVLPALRCDRGDLNILGKLGLFPLPIQSRDEFDDGFLGPMGALNWDAAHLRELRASDEWKFRLVRAAARLIPGAVRLPVAQMLSVIARTICEVHNTNPDRLGS